MHPNSGPVSALALARVLALACPFVPLHSVAAQDANVAPVSDQAGDTASADPANAILVTARRRAEDVSDVPLAISIVSGDTIDATGSFNVNKLQQIQPSLTFYSSNPRNTSINIRGIGAPFGLANDGIEQGVGIYIDDVYYARVAASTFDFLDVERIEVLRGPQGTLYGKNTTAGALNITTRQPTFDFEGMVQVSAGNLGYLQGKAAISGPLSDTLAARIVISATKRSGTLFRAVSDRHESAGIPKRLKF